MNQRDKIKYPLSSMAFRLYRIFISDAIHEPRKDLGGDIILSKEEQGLLLLSFVCYLLELRSMKSLYLELIYVYLRESRDPSLVARDHKNGAILLIGTVMRINDSMRVYTKMNPTLFDKRSEPDFCKGLNETQIALAMSWYTGHTEAIAPAFRLMCSCFEMSDEYFDSIKEESKKDTLPVIDTYEFS